MSLEEDMLTLAKQAKTASRELARLNTEDKNGCLIAMADALEAKSAEIEKANHLDIEAAPQYGLSSAMIERLKLNQDRIAAMATGLREVAALPDPTGKVLDERSRPNGLGLQKVTTPIGVVVIIYESRPNVTADAAGLCFKAGNATILRGGKEAIHSNQIIAEVMVTAAREHLSSFPEHAFQVVPTTDREAIPALLSLTEQIDLCMPRGGEGLIRAVADCSKVPVIKHYKGVCHVYVHREANLEMAEAIAINSKCQRPSVCNAMESLLIDEAVADTFAPSIVKKFLSEGVEVRVDAETRSRLKEDTLARQVKDATEEDWTTEYNNLTVSIATVPNIQSAISHINRYGSGHSDSIVTENESIAKQFLHDVDSAAVYWNASTRFTDGAVFGMGAEIGISTDKVGARGPMGLDELTTYKWLGYGTGQIRE